MGFLTSEVRQCQLLVTHLPLATVSGREMAWEHIAVLFAGCEMIRLIFAVLLYLIYDNCRCLVCPPPLWVEGKNKLLVTKQEQIYRKGWVEEQLDFRKCKP